MPNNIANGSEIAAGQVANGLIGVRRIEYDFMLYECLRSPLSLKL